MKRSRSLNPLSVLFGLLCTLTLALYAYPSVTTSAQERDDVAAVTQAWERARATGSYRYVADIIQTTIPRPTITNVGRTSSQDELHIEGDTSLPDRTMHLQLWSQGGSVINHGSEAEVRVEDDRAYARQGAGAWEEVNNFTGFFAPQGDFMAFLSAAKDITDQGTETRQIPNPSSPMLQSRITFTRYTFRVDGLSYARYMRDQIEQQLAEKGELPSGVNLDLPRQYVDMTGEGELWVGEDGLPLRQIIHLEMDQRSDARIEAEITVGFSDFGYAQAAENREQSTGGSGSRIQGIGISQIASPRMLQQALLFTSVLALCGLVVVNSRSKKVYVALVLAVIASMIITPLLRSVHAARFADRQATREREQKEREEKSEMERNLRHYQTTTSLSGRPHHPNRSPLAPSPWPEPKSSDRNPLSPLDSGQGALAPPAQFVPAAALSDGRFNCQDDDGTDSDDDGLTDCQEELLGTDPDGVDSDGDLITDTLEVQGFNYGSKTWYSDPLEVDTNKDGINDAQEWNVPGSAHADWDTDDDGVPDLFDRDNDGDGVPDEIDLSPFTKKTDTFTGEDPFLFQINNLEPGKPTYVEFQLRPTNPDHLWYAFNVLDWPLGDKQGQMQDKDGATFYDVDSSNPLFPYDNGDLKLIPMLEIRISGYRTHLPSQAELDHYGIFSVDMNRSGSDRAVYVPLHLVTEADDEGRAMSRVAFYGKMFYRPEVSWGNAHQVRLVWLVQALVDVCKPDGYENGVCVDYEKLNEQQLIHTYFDDWTLTGLNVREDHGVDAAFVYEDPAVDSDLETDAMLYAFAHSLEYTFLAARDSDGIAGRDITLDEIYRRFNHTTNWAVSEDERWGITNTLSVELHTYEHLDVAAATIPMTDTKELLERAFTPYWSESAPVTPTLMLLREIRSRGTNLDAEGRNNTILWEGTQLTVDLPPSGDDGVQVTTVAGVNWAPYRFNGAAWDAFPIDEYWEELERLYTFDEVDDRDEAAGMVFFLQMFYLSLFQGVNTTVQVGDVPMVTGTALGGAAVAAKTGVKLALLAGKSLVVMTIIEQVVNAILGKLGKAAVEFSKPERFFKLLGLLKLHKALEGLKETVKSNLKWAFSKSGWGAGVLLVLAVIVVILLVAVAITAAVFLVIALKEAGAFETIAGYLKQALEIAWVQETIKWVTIVVRWVGPFVSLAIGIYCVITTTLVAVTVLSAAITLLIEIAVIWIAFFVQWALTGFSVGVATNMLIAYAIVQTLLAILLFVLIAAVAIVTGQAWLGVLVGVIIGFIIGLIEAFSLTFFDFSPLDWITKQIATVFYNVNPMVDPTVDVKSNQFSLRDPERGFSSANAAKYAMMIETTLETKDPAWWQYESFSSLYLYSESLFVTTTLKYKLDRGMPSEDDETVLVPVSGFPGARPGELNLNSWVTAWGQLFGDDVMEWRKAIWEQNVEQTDFVPLEAGINYHIPTVLATSYVVPLIECWLPLLPYGICYTSLIEGENASDLGMVYDVYPGSLDSFYALSPYAGGYRLGWDSTFPVLKDADGDGLISPAHEGPDPDDSTWDADGDGLSDAYELTLRQAGVNLDPENGDTDGDTLSDADEVRLGTNPAWADSDGDHLPDATEVFHENWNTKVWEGGWAFDAAGVGTLATSDPTVLDTDGDGMSDLAEWTLHDLNPAEYALHPHVANASPIALYAAISDEDGFVAPGTTFVYTASVQNNLVTPLYSVGNLTVNFPPQLTAADIVADFMLFLGQAITVTRDVAVPAGAASTSVDVENQMDSQLTGNPSCATVEFYELYCNTQEDDQTDLHPPGSEVMLLLDQDGIWSEVGITNGENVPINEVREFCDQAMVELHELEWEPVVWHGNNLETWTIDVDSQGSFTQPINDDPTFAGSLNYAIYYPGGSINLDETIPVIIDAEPPTDSTITSLADGQYIRSTGETLIVGGIAQDPTSNIATVEISVDGGLWEEAFGAESWAYAWQVPMAAGPYTLRTRATDAVGYMFTETVGTTVIVDIYVPDIDTSIQNGDIITAALGAEGRWNVPLYGTVQDLLDVGNPVGSGVRAVQVLLEGVGEVSGQGWQTATLAAPGANSSDWSIDYVLPAFNDQGEAVLDPTGEYYFMMRAIDNAGNITPDPMIETRLLRIDNSAPIASVTDTGPGGGVITQSLTIGGVITDVGVVAKGLAGLDIAYTPVALASGFPPEELALLLHLDEPAGATVFRDAAGTNDGFCQSPTCPNASVSGVAGTGLSFDGVSEYVEIPIDLSETGYAASLWFNTTCADCGLFSVDAGSLGSGGNDRHIYLSGGNLCARVWSNETICTSGAGYADGAFHHVVHTFGGNAGGQSLYVDGGLEAAGLQSSSDFDWQTGANLGFSNDAATSYLNGLIDEVAVLNRGLSASEVRLLYETGGQHWFDWQPAALAQTGEGITRTTWSHVVPSNLPENLYQIDLRGTDVLSNQNDVPFTWPQWQGEIDLHEPRVEAGWQWAGVGEAARTEYTCKAEDFGLVEAGFECPCPVLPGDRHTYGEGWYSTWISDTARLYRIETSCLVPGRRPAPTVRACDRYGHCGEDTPILMKAVAAITSPLDSVIFTPTYGAVLTAADPISVAGGAYTSFAAGLRTLTVTVDSSVIYTKTWITNTSWGEIWSTTWFTLTEGPHTLLSVVDSHNGPTPGTHYVQTDTRPITIVVDTLAPEIALPTGPLTTGHRLPGGQLAVTSPYTEAGGVASIQVGEAGDEWGDAAAQDESSWRYVWFLSEEPDGVPYTLTAHIEDVAGRTDQQTETLIVDLVLPAPVTVTLAYTDSLGVRTVISPGQTIYDVLSPMLSIEWTESSDGSGLAGYWAGWTTEPDAPVSALSGYGLSDERVHTQQVADLQAVFAHVVVEDSTGNRRFQTLGPIYTDITTTPDYVMLPTLSTVGSKGLSYRGWMDSGCTQIGADRDLARYAQTAQALTGTQRFYATWNTAAGLGTTTDTLRLAWTGANWTSDGDLFIYLDTAPGGTSAVHDPYVSSISINLPAEGGQQMAADYLVWVEDADTATLMAWDGGSWTDAVTDTLSGPPYYYLDTTVDPAHTDLYLPFSWLSITTTTPVKMVALASEEDALRIWAAMPEKNPLNSQLAINTLAEVGQIGNVPYTLTQGYQWASLAPDMCPNAGQFTDADLLVDLTADPPGVEVGYLAHDLLHLTPGQPLDSDLDSEPDMALPMDTDPGVVGHGMIVTYSLHYANDGTEIAPGVKVTVTARGAIQLTSNPLVVDLGNVTPGITETVEFTGMVNTTVHTRSLEVVGVVGDAVHGPFDWLWIQHDVDRAAPTDVAIVEPLRYIIPHTNTVQGTVYDPSGVPTITLESQLLPLGIPSQVTCIDGTPHDGQWSCDWNIGPALNGDQFKLRAVVTDTFGNGPAYGEWMTLTVDTLPPTISLDPESDAALDGVVLGPNDEVFLTGLVEDDQEARSAEVCFEGTDGEECEQVPANPGSTSVGSWGYALSAREARDYEDETVYLYGVDGAGNRSPDPLSRTYGVDTVAPVVTVTTWVRNIPSVTPTVVLSGTVSDGSGSSDVYVIAEAPDETFSSTLPTHDGSNWRYTLRPEMEGVYALRIEARDAKGNVSGYGPYNVSVGVNKIYLPLVLRN